MLQLASATATLAQGGAQYKPHVVVATQDSISQRLQAVAAGEPAQLGYKPEHVALIKRALASVTQDGTSARVFAGAGYLSAGKTGTAQAVTIGQKDKYNASKLEEHQRDHSLYMAFAPVDAPQVALAVVVENAGFGAAHAAPIARRVFDYLLMGQYPSEEDMAAVQKGLAASPIGKPREAASLDVMGRPLAGSAPVPAASASSAASAPPGRTR